VQLFFSFDSDHQNWKVFCLKFSFLLLILLFVSLLISVNKFFLIFLNYLISKQNSTKNIWEKIYLLLNWLSYLHQHGNQRNKDNVSSLLLEEKLNSNFNELCWMDLEHKIAPSSKLESITQKNIAKYLSRNLQLVT
jgi:hypothetical protein